MAAVKEIFERIENLITINDDNKFKAAVFKNSSDTSSDLEIEEGKDYEKLKLFLANIILEIDKLATIIKSNDGVLISVKNQKTLRTCFQVISSFGILPYLLPGLGISLSKRCKTVESSLHLKLSDEEKYVILTACTDFLQRSYDIPVLKNIIITSHLMDYLAALIQLSFAPLKQPGVYSNFTMTQEMYDKLNMDRQKYIQIYEYLVNNCFQPMLMKELLVLQNVREQNTPLFVKRVIAKEMSRRLIVSGGLLSLIRCFIDGQDRDTGLEWKKIDMICKIISNVHCNMSESEYLKNITSQMKHVFTINKTKCLVTATSCLITLYEKYKHDEQVKGLVNDIFATLNYRSLLSKSCLPGTIALASSEIEHCIQILHACTCLIPCLKPPKLITSNLYILFLLRIKSSKDERKIKITNIILKVLELVGETDMPEELTVLLFGITEFTEVDISVDESETGLIIKYVNSHVDYPEDEAVRNFVEVFNAAENNGLIKILYESCLKIFIDINKARQEKNCNMLHSQDESMSLSSNDNKYIQMLNILSEISASKKVIRVLEESPLTVINFVDMILLQNIDNTNDECKTIALLLLNTILPNVNKTRAHKDKLHLLIPKLKLLAENDTEYIKILCKESLALILSEYPKAKESAFEKVITDIFNNLLPVRAHGIVELNKLIDMADPETISKRHYVLCLLQEQLKDTDSYIYLSTINCLASLALHFTSDVLSVLCKEYLDVTINSTVEIKENRNKSVELRMKIGDVVVKVTKRLGEMAAAHKIVLLNTILCACKDDDPFIRTSALSNLAEIALVLHYKMGSLIYEVLHCIWSIIRTDEAIECRRAGVMVLTSLLRGLGSDMLIELKENLLPIYRTLNKLCKDTNGDAVVKLHAQLALEELNNTVKETLFTELPIKKEISILKKSKDIAFK